MNRNYKNTFIFLAVTLLSVLFTGLYFNGGENAADSEAEIFFIREYNGCAAIFSEDKSTPDEVLDVKLSSLPERDALDIINGIEITSKEELYRLIEDFTS